jgi:protein gp37
MAEVTKIQWTDHTFNPWRGCTKVSEGCKFCYAEKQAKRNPKVLGIWGPQGTRPIASPSYWNQAYAWNEAAKREGVPHKVFCASMADVCEDRDDLLQPRSLLKDLIESTPYLIWQLLTKRPEHFLRFFGDLADEEGQWPDNVWPMTSVENQDQADIRIRHLLKVPAKIRGLSVEPLLGPIEFDYIQLQYISWVIIGGESGPNARPCQIEWIRKIVKQCKTAGVSVFVKQLGARIVDFDTTSADTFPEEMCWPEGTKTNIHSVLLKDHKGGDPAEWPPDLRIREFPI